VEELRRYFAEWRDSNIGEFWHRKSRKPVLAVVVVCTNSADDGDQFVTYRGMNTEVSLPAGSLCAERAAIAAAASDLRPASSIVAISVMDADNKIRPLWPCEVCQSWLVKLRPQSPEIAVCSVASTDCSSFALRVNGELQSPQQG
jgi:cytidine deaminase